MSLKLSKICSWTVGIGIAGFIMGAKVSYARNLHEALVEKSMLAAIATGALIGLILGTVFTCVDSQRARKRHEETNSEPFR